MGGHGPVAGEVARSVDRTDGASGQGDLIRIGVAVDIPEPWGGQLTR
ncbi:2'-5' RNA ligase family protein, partial [Micromonospora azadirachtae]